MLGTVAKILESSFIDGFGHRAVVFLQGCDLRCAYCHNPETLSQCSSCGMCVQECPENALLIHTDGILGRSVAWNEKLCISCGKCTELCPHFSSPKLKIMTPEALTARILPLASILDGITFSGGECTLQSDFIIETSHLIKATTHLSVFIDTNGNASREIFNALANEIDSFMIDLKALSPNLHLRLTGKDNTLILENIQHAAKIKKLHEVRTVVAPGYTDTHEEIRAISQFISSLSGSVPLKLICFRPDGVKGALSSVPPIQIDLFMDLVKTAETFLSNRVIPLGI